MGDEDDFRARAMAMYQARGKADTAEAAKLVKNSVRKEAGDDLAKDDYRTAAAKLYKMQGPEKLCEDCFKPGSRKQTAYYGMPDASALLTVADKRHWCKSCAASHPGAVFISAAEDGDDSGITQLTAKVSNKIKSSAKKQEDAKKEKEKKVSNFVLKMDFVLKITSFVLKMMNVGRMPRIPTECSRAGNFLLKNDEFPFKISIKNDELCIKNMNFALNCNGMFTRSSSEESFNDWSSVRISLHSTPILLQFYSFFPPLYSILLQFYSNFTPFSLHYTPFYSNFTPFSLQSTPFYSNFTPILLQSIPFSLHSTPT